MLEMLKVLGSVEIDPIHQFQIQKWVDLGNIGGQHLWITNATGFMLLSSALVVLLFGIAASRSKMVPSRIQSVGERGYGFVADMIRSIAGEEGLKFFPFIFTLFFFILAANVVGLVPYAFTTTSHIAVTLPLALLVISIVTIYGFYKNGFRFLKLFMPSGAPWPVYILLIPIEIISFLVRPLTLSLRLFGNMLAGHIVLKLFAGFAVSLFAAGGVYMLLAPFAFIMGVVMNALEFLVAALQAYIFAMLTCVYINDALHPAH